MRMRSGLLALIVLLALLLAACNQHKKEPLTTEEDTPLEATGVTLDRQVAVGSDDAEQSAAGAVSVASIRLELTRDASEQTVGIRFTNLTIPPGSIITNAYVQFKVNTVTSEATSLTVQGEAADNAATFATTVRNISNRPRTVASAPWNPLPWTVKGAAGADQRTPNLATVIQEIVNRPGWASGNAVAIIVTGTGKRVAESYESVVTKAPILHVEYDVPPVRYDLTVTKGGGGAGTVTGGTINCGSTCTANYLAGTPVTLTATPESGSVFTGWSGACTGTGDCTLTVDSNKAVTATFEPQFTLTVSSAGAGTGIVTGNGISCGSDCEEAYSSGTEVTLVATPAGDSAFAGWGGACSGTADCTVTMNSNQAATATFNLIPPPTYEILSISQASHFLTGCTTGSLCATGERLTIPSTDPASVEYYPPSNSLFIADSEIEELAPPRHPQNIFANVNRNIFRTSLMGDTLTGSWNFKNLNNNHEPTGIAYCANDNHFYVTNDDSKRLYRYAFNGTTFTLATSVLMSATSDPEGAACDPSTGRIYVAGGKGINIYVYRYTGSFILEEVIDLFTTAGTPAGVPSDPEGIAFDVLSQHIFLVSGVDEAIFEYTRAGAYVKKFDLSGFTPAPIAVQGLTIGPASSNGGAEAFYIADGGIDNNDDLTERDGIIFEAQIQR
jgi:Divergent InlB B-repeat domain